MSLQKTTAYQSYQAISLLFIALSLAYACDLSEKKEPIAQILDMDIPVESIFQEGVCRNLIKNVEDNCCGLIKDLSAQFPQIEAKSIDHCEQTEQLLCLSNDDLNAFESHLTQGDQSQLALNQRLAFLTQGECAGATEALKQYQTQFKQCQKASCEFTTPVVQETLLYCQAPSDPNFNLACGLDDSILYQPNLYPSQELLSLKENAFELLPSEIVNEIAPPLPSILSAQAIELTAPIQQIQFSIPSDFISNLMSRGGLRASLSPLFEQREEDRFYLPWSCQQEPLLCRSFPTNLIKNALEVNLAQIRTTIHLSIASKTPMNAFEDPSLQVPQNQSLQLDFKGMTSLTTQVLFEKGGILLENIEPTEVRFDQASFRLLPTHDPKASNGYPSELSAQAHQWINQAELLWDLDEAQCLAISSEIESMHLREKNSLTQTPYRCRCLPPPEAQSNAQWIPYCVTDPYPYPQGKGDLQGIASRSILFLCDQKGELGLAPDTIGHRLEITETLYASLRSFISDDLTQFACQGLVGNQGDRLNTKLKPALNQAGMEEADQQAPEHFGEYIAFELKLPISGGKMRVKLSGDQGLALKIKAPLKQRWQRDQYRFDFETLWQEQSEFQGISLAQDAEILFSLLPQNGEFLIDAADEALIFHGTLRYQRSSAGKSQIASLRRVVYDRPRQRTHLSSLAPLSYMPNPQNTICRLSGIDQSLLPSWMKEDPSVQSILNTETCHHELIDELSAQTITEINERLLGQLGPKLQNLYDYAINQAIFSKSKLGLWGYLIKAIQQRLWFTPLSIAKYVDEEQAQDLELNLPEITQLWGPTAWLCASHDAPDLACPLVARSFGVKHSSIERIYTQASPNTLTKIFGVSTLNPLFPPVLFCDNEKNIPQLEALREAQAQGFDVSNPQLLRNRFLKQDLMQKDEFDPLDLRGVNAQCSVQVQQSFDLKNQSLFGGASQLKIIPTLRTQALINRSFECRTLGHCSPDIPESALDDGNQLSSRTHLAMCSLMADIWYQPSQDQAWLSLVEVIKNSQLMETQSVIAALLGEYGLASAQSVRDFSARFANCSGLLRELQLPIAQQPILTPGRCEQNQDCASIAFCPLENEESCVEQQCQLNGQSIRLISQNGEALIGENIDCLQNRRQCFSAEAGALVAHEQSTIDLQEALSPLGVSGENMSFTELTLAPIQAENQAQKMLAVIGDQKRLYLSLLTLDEQNQIQAQPWQRVGDNMLGEQGKPMVLWNSVLNQGVVLWLSSTISAQNQIAISKIQFQFLSLSNDAQTLQLGQGFEIASNAVSEFKAKYVEDTLLVLFKDQDSQLLRLWSYHEARGIQSQLITQGEVQAFDLAEHGAIAWSNTQGNVFVKALAVLDAQAGLSYQNTMLVNEQRSESLYDLSISPRTTGHLLIEHHRNANQSTQLKSYAISEAGRVLRANQDIDQLELLLAHDFVKASINGLIAPVTSHPLRALLYAQTIPHPIQGLPIQVFYLQPIDEQGEKQDEPMLIQSIPLNQPKQTTATFKLTNDLLWVTSIENQSSLKILIQRNQCR